MGLYSKWPMSTAFSEILTLQFSTYFIMIHVFSSLQYSNFLQSFQDSWDVNGLCSCKTFLDFCNEIRIDFAFLQKFLNSGDRFPWFLQWNQNRLHFYKVISTPDMKTEYALDTVFLDFCDEIRIDSWRVFLTLQSAFLDICNEIRTGFAFCTVFPTPAMGMEYAVAKVFLLSVMISALTSLFCRVFSTLDTVFLDFCDKIKIDFIFCRVFSTLGTVFFWFLRWNQNRLHFCRVFLTPKMETEYSLDRRFLDFCDEIRIDFCRVFSTPESVFLGCCDEFRINFAFLQSFLDSGDSLSWFL